MNYWSILRDVKVIDNPCKQTRVIDVTTLVNPAA
jgi:hypothetical protein